MNRWIRTGIKPQIPTKWQARTAEYLAQVEQLDVFARFLQAMQGGKVQAERQLLYTFDQYVIKSALDVCWLQTDNHAVILDWKTGSDPDDTFQADYALQRLIYALALFKYPHIKTVECHWLDGDYQPVAYTAQDKPHLENQLRERIAEVMNQEPVAAASVRQFFCEGCPGLKYCCGVSQII